MLKAILRHPPMSNRDIDLCRRASIERHAGAMAANRVSLNVASDGKIR